MIRPKTRSDKGATLIELMIVLVIAVILVGGIYSLFMTQQRSYSVQDQVTGVQQDARAALTIMARDIRMSGMAIGAGSGTGFTDGSTNVTVSVPGGNYNFAVTPQNNAEAPDSITVVFGAEELGQVQSVNGSDVTLDHDVDAYFATKPLFVAFDLRPGRVYGVTGVNNANITVTNAPSDLLIGGGRAYGVQTIRFQVKDNVLQRIPNGGTSQPIAGDGIATIVEDLQFAYQLIGSNDWIFHQVGDTWPAGRTNADIRMVRISLIVRTIVPDPKETGFFKPACEDHARDNSNPGCRRRVYTTEVKLRNFF